MAIFFSQVGDEQPIQWIQHPAEIAKALEQARQLLNDERFSEARLVLDALVKAGNAEAQYLDAGFSKPGELPEDFEERRTEQLARAAEQGYPPALYALGASYDSDPKKLGDRHKAAQLFRRAALLGHAHSQWIYGFDLLYGSNGIEQDVQSGIAQIVAAGEKKFQGALETLARFHERGEFGFPVDMGKAASFRQAALGDDVIGY